MTTSDLPVRHAHRPRRRTRLLRTLAVLVALGVVAAAVIYGWKSLGRHRVVADSCVVVGQSTGAAYAMDPEQLLNASTIADIAMRRALPQQAVIIALATAQQESKLRNLDYGDRDSIGLFQQRPSQGWGTKEQLIDPLYAGGKFFDALLKVSNWQGIPVAAAAQAVQRSGFPDAYGSWQQRATALAAALTGTTSGQLSCRLAHPGIGLNAGQNANSSSPDGVVESLDGAVSALTAALAADIAVTSPAVTTQGSKSATITVSGLAAEGDGDDTLAKHRTGTVAAWALAHAPEGVTRVVVGDQEWRPDRDGWRATHDVAAPGTVVLTVSTR